jgi:hypothetical protein
MLKGNSLEGVRGDGDIFSNVFFCVTFGQIDATLMQPCTVHTCQNMFRKGQVDVFREHLKPSQGAGEILSLVRNVQSPAAAGANFNRSAG